MDGVTKGRSTAHQVPIAPASWGPNRELLREGSCHRVEPALPYLTFKAAPFTFRSIKHSTRRRNLARAPPPPTPSSERLFWHLGSRQSPGMWPGWVPDAPTARPGPQATRPSHRCAPGTAARHAAGQDRLRSNSPCDVDRHLPESSGCPGMTYESLLSSYSLP